MGLLAQEWASGTIETMMTAPVNENTIVVGRDMRPSSPDLARGDLVMHMLGWRDEAVLPARQARKVTPENSLSPSAYLGVLGMTTLTAYVGLLDIAAFQPGEVVFVSGAAGAVGSMAGQIARLKGAGRVIGSAGSEEKVRWLREIGFDAAFNYRNGSVMDQLRQAAPDGMIRFVVGPQGEVVPDLARCLPGRGLWVRAERTMVEKAMPLTQERM